MNHRTRHRIIGILVIIALILIVVPLFVKHHQAQGAMYQQSIPLPPKAPKVVNNVPPKTDQLNAPEVKLVQSNTSTNDTISQSVVSDQTTSGATSGVAESIPSCNGTSGVCVAPTTDSAIRDGNEVSTDEDATSTVAPTVEKPKMVITPVALKTRPLNLQKDNSIEKIAAIALNESAKKTLVENAKPIPKFINPTEKQQKNLAKADANANAWILQLGYFKNAKNADKLINRLRGKGFAAFGYKVLTNNGPATHVFVGPSVKYAQAKSSRDRLAKLMKMKGYIVKFDASKMN